jgi:hypothetical protein
MRGVTPGGARIEFARMRPADGDPFEPTPRA